MGGGLFVNRVKKIVEPFLWISVPGVEIAVITSKIGSNKICTYCMCSTSTRHSIRRIPQGL